MHHNRVQFDADDDVWSILAPHRSQRGDLKRYLNEAVRSYANPSFQIHVPETDTDFSLELLLRGAQHSIAAIGVSLRHILNHSDLLKEQIASRQMHMAFILLRRNITIDEPLFEIMERQWESRYLAEAEIKRINRSIMALQSLSQFAAQYETLVEVRCIEEIPMCGLIVRDHGKDGARMHVKIYNNLSLSREKPHPFFDIDPKTESGEKLYSVYYEYYERLLKRSTALR